MKRLFIGTHVDDSLFEFLYKGIQDDFNPVCTGKWVENENLHFTYKFLGNVEDNKIPEIMNLLKEELTTFNSSLIFKGLGSFPDTKKPNILFCRIFNPNKQIFQLQESIDDKLATLGFEKERRRFKAHLTLRRIKTYTKNFENILSFYKDFEIGEMQSFSVNLIESTLTPQGPIYKILEKE
jgi:2'-5' RNA ligase